ncbi:MAG: hypothetical protein CM1200mP17_16100 [Woeseia sp.]|nr:MAG: hypothetical protein CM1200mP17_16100 [Woeseia sp.]
MNQGMLVSGIILAISFIGIFTETLHGFHRVKVAMLGAGVMVVVGQIYGFYTPDCAFQAVDWNVVFLLAGNDGYCCDHDQNRRLFKFLPTKLGVLPKADNSSC